MQMELRKNRKKKIMGDEDLGYEEKPPKSHKKNKSKLKQEKENSKEEVSFILMKNNSFSKIVFRHIKRTQRA